MNEFTAKTREDLFSEIPPNGIGAEIGVNDGAFSEIILKNNNPFKLYLVDCWEYVEGLSTFVNPDNHPTEVKNKQYFDVFNRFDKDLRVHLIKDYSKNAVKLFPDKHFDWIYIDADHRKCAEDLELWYPKVKIGGYLAGHDYTKMLYAEPVTIKYDVDDFVKEKGFTLYTTEEIRFPSFIFRRDHE